MVNENLQRQVQEEPKGGERCRQRDQEGCGRGRAQQQTGQRWGLGEVRDGRELPSGGQWGFPKFICYVPSRVIWYDEAGPSY